MSRFFIRGFSPALRPEQQPKCVRFVLQIGAIINGEFDGVELNIPSEIPDSSDKPYWFNALRQ
jgi:hypothetical protein